MDIRKFFGSTPNKPAAKKKEDTSSNELTKIKNGKDRNKGDIVNDKPSVQKDVNGNKPHKGHHREVKHKHQKNEKPKASSKKKPLKSQDDEEDEVIDIDDCSDEEPIGRKRKDDKSQPEKSRRKSNEKPQKDGKSSKKRKIQESSDEDFASKKDDVKIDDYDDDDDDDEVIVMRKKSKSKAKNKKRKLLDSDSDEDPVPKEKKARKKRTIVHIGGADGYEEEEVHDVKPKKTMLDNFVASAKMQQQNTDKVAADSKSKKPADNAKKPTVSAMDFFGTGSVHRVERKTVSSTPSKVADVKMEEESMDVELHDDDDFERTLELLDEQGSGAEKKTEIKPSGGSLSSKLASKVKQSAVLVPDTPSSKQISPKKAKMEFIMDRTEKKGDRSPSKPTDKKSPVKSLVSPSKQSPDKPSSVSPGRPTPAKRTPTKTSPGKDGTKKTPPKHSDSLTPGQKGTSYRSYLNRAGPQALGSKEVPEGGENCLEGLTFVITGVLDAFERDEAKSIIEKYGGKVTGSISKKTDYLLAGQDAGQSKVAKAESFKTKIINEDDMLDLIRTRPGKKSKYTLQAEEAARKEKLQSKTSVRKSDSSATIDYMDSQSSVSSLKSDHSVTKKEIQMDHSKSSSQKSSTTQSGSSLLWVDKYKPTMLKQIIGQTGDKSNAKKLLHWLTHWHKNQAAGAKPAPGRFFGGGGSGDGTGYKAALLSGPPGIGKTTTATLVCKEAGFTFVELNASDTRNAKSLKEVVAQSVRNMSIMDYMGTGASSTHGHKHCLVMDEVDGMSGNEDRGGIQELVNIIKHSQIPIITMCNDRNHQKMRTLSNHCFDLRFQRPRVEQIKAAVMSIAFKEGLNIPAPAVQEIIVAANQDMRQVIHNLSMWTAADKAVTYEQVKKDAQHAKKDVKIGPFDVCRKVFVGGEETRNMSINDKSDLFFHDYNIAPLFVQENYIHVVPYAARGNMKKHLSLLARTADSLCDGDLVEKKIRSAQSWSLLSTEAMYASVIPGEYMRGNLNQMTAFPAWLGKNSTTGKTDRILQELQCHMRLKVSGDKRSLNMDYLPYLRNSLTEPLVTRETEGVPDVIRLLDEYDIIKDDFDNILEVTRWPNSDDPLKKLSTKTKAAFTRMYNKESHMTPYSTGAVAKKKRGGGGASEGDLMGGEDGDWGATEEGAEEEEDDTIDTDSMIKKKTTSKAAPAASSSKAASKGKGPAKGKSTAGASGKGKGKGKR